MSLNGPFTASSRLAIPTDALVMANWLSVHPVTVRAFNGSTVTLQVGTAEDRGGTVHAAMRVDGETPVWLPSGKLRELVASLRKVGREIGVNR